MIYQQYLDERIAKKYPLKKLFLVLGFINITLGFVLAIIFGYIYWKFCLPFVALFLVGIVFGSIAYTFCKSYKYTFENGTFTVCYLNCYGRYKVSFIADKESIKKVCGKGKRLTNLEKCIVIEVNGSIYEISPDDYLTALLFGE